MLHIHDGNIYSYGTMSYLPLLAGEAALATLDLETRAALRNLSAFYQWIPPLE